MVTSRKLWALTIVFVLLLLPATAWIIYTVSRQSLVATELEDIRNELDLFVSNLQGEIEKYAFLPSLLAADPNIVHLLNHPDDRVNVHRVNENLAFVNQVSRASDTYVVSADGTTLAASNWEQAVTFVGENFSYRPYFTDAMNGSPGRYFALGTTSRERGYYFSAPVRGGDGEIIGTTVVKVSMARLERTWRDYKIVTAIADDRTVIFASSKPEWLYRSLLPLTDADLAEIERSRQYPLNRIKPLEVDPVDVQWNGSIVNIDDGESDIAYLTGSEHLPEMGWTVYAFSDSGNLVQASLYRVAAALLIAALLWTIVLAALLRRMSLREQLALRERTERQLIESRDRLEEMVRERTSELEDSNRKLIQTRDELVQAAKLATLGQLSAGITHELNQPLAAIQAYADNALALLDRDDPAAARGSVDEVARLTERMGEITRHLKSFARRTDDSLQPMRMRESIHDALALLKPRVGKAGVQVDVDLVDEDHVMANCVRLEQVFVNLVTNAIDAMEQTPEKKVTIGQELQGDTIVTRVRDSGPGLVDIEPDRIFDPFFTTKDVGVGLGLGLSISHGIIRQLGGDLVAAQAGGGGAEFIVTLQRIPQ